MTEPICMCNRGEHAAHERGCPARGGGMTVLCRQQSADYYVKVIEESARRLRAENVGHMVATDLEDSLRWSDDPQTCSHPYWNCRTDGSTVCRTCGYDTSHIDPMGG